MGKPYTRDYDQYVRRPEGTLYRTAPAWGDKSLYLHDFLTADMILAALAKMEKDLKSATSEGPLTIGGQGLPGDVHVPGSRNYAVAVPFIFGGGDVFLLLTKRSSDLDTDPGHISFPGGKLEKGESFYQAALREAKEEIDLDIGEIKKSAFIGMFERPLSEMQRRYVAGDNSIGFGEKQVLGSEVVDDEADFDGPYLSDSKKRDEIGLSDLTKKQKIAAFAFITDENVALHPNTDEVETIFWLPVRSLFSLEVAWNEIWISPEGDEREIHFFGEPNIMGNNLIWGLTARIIAVILEQIALSV